jgi:hypothetical protein
MVIPSLTINPAGGAHSRLVFILCGTESTKNISTRYKTYSLVDLHQLLHIKCILLAQFSNFGEQQHINNKRFFTMSRYFVFATFQLPYFFYRTCTNQNILILDTADHGLHCHPSSSHFLLCCLFSSPTAAPLVCSRCPCLSSCLSLPLINRSHHRLSTVALHHLSADHLLLKLLLHHLLSATVVSSCLPPLHSLMADCQVVVWWPPPPNNPILSAIKSCCCVVSCQQPLSPCWLRPMCRQLILFLRHC